MPSILVRDGAERIQISNCHFDSDNALRFFTFSYRRPDGSVDHVTYLLKHDTHTIAKWFPVSREKVAPVVGATVGAIAGAYFDNPGIAIGAMGGGILGSFARETFEKYIDQFLGDEEGYYDTETHQHNSGLKRVYYRRDVQGS